MRSEMLNGGAYTRSAFMGAAAIVAGGAGDATDINGPWYDRVVPTVPRPLSCKIVVAYSAVLGDGETLSITGKLQDATDDAGAGAADYGTALAATVIATGGTGGTTEVGTAELDFEIEGAREFIRSVINPDLSRANTDTADISIVAVLFGGNRVPYSKTLI